MNRKVMIASGSIIVLALAWFVAVDRSWFVESCPHCGYSRDLVQYRLANICLKENTANAYPTIVQRVAADLGVECMHPEASRWQKHRYWGLLFCAAPCVNGTSGLVGDDSWYDRTSTAKIRFLASSRPAIREEFCERVLRNHDSEFFEDLLDVAGVLPRTEEPSLIEP